MRGFTLIEVTMLLSTLVVVGIALNTMIFNFYRSNAYLLQETSAIDKAHRGLRNSFQDLREASYGDDGSYPIQSAATSSITFFSDIDGDGSVEKIHLYLQSGSLYRGVTDSTSSPPTYVGQTEKVETIADYVVNGTSTPLFSYYDTDGNLMASSTIDVSQVTSISTSIMVDLNPKRAPDILTLQERATLRNLRNQ